MRAAFAQMVRAGKILLRVEPPVTCADGSQTDYIVSSIAFTDYGCETYLFPANAAGEIIDWGELPGSMQGVADHDEALKNAGYEVIWGKE